MNRPGAKEGRRKKMLKYWSGPEALKRRPAKTAAREILPRLKKRETTLGAERERLGLKWNRQVRRALTEVLGSKAAYRKMILGSKQAYREI